MTFTCPYCGHVEVVAGPNLIAKLAPRFPWVCICRKTSVYTDGALHRPGEDELQDILMTPSWRMDVAGQLNLLEANERCKKFLTQLKHRSSTRAGEHPRGVWSGERK